MLEYFQNGPGDEGLGSCGQYGLRLQQRGESGFGDGREQQAVHRHGGNLACKWIVGPVCSMSKACRAQ